MKQITFQGLALLTLSWDKNRDSHSLVNVYPSFYPRIALVAPSPGHYTLATEHMFSLVSGRANLCILWNELYQMLSKGKICAYIYCNELRAVENVLLLLPSIYSLESYRNRLSLQANRYSHACCLLKLIHHYKNQSLTHWCFCIPERFSFVYLFSF